MISPSVAFSLCLAVWGLQPSQPPPPTPSVAAQEEQELSSSKEKNSATGQPDIKSGLVTKKNNSEECNRGDADQKSSPDWITRFTGMLAIVALLQLIAMVAQAKYMRHALRDGKKAADAATQSVQSLKILNRARINVEAIFFENVENEKSETFRVKCKMRNSGTTTAHIFKQLDSFFWLEIDRELPKQPPYAEAETLRDFDMAPNQVISWLTDPPIQKSKVDNWEQIGKGTLRLFAVGYIKYRDEFGDEHETRYTIQFRPGQPEPAVVTKAGYNSAT